MQLMVICKGYAFLLRNIRFFLKVLYMRRAAIVAPLHLVSDGKSSYLQLKKGGINLMEKQSFDHEKSVTHDRRF